MQTEHKDHQNWLQELSNQSWNLELLVSGAAIFSTSYLPGLCDDALAYYVENYQSSPDMVNSILPTLAFAFAKAASYLLIVTFFAHFILRAFWIGLVGLRAVFPKGIQYENIPNTNEKLREIYRQRFGNFDDYIVWLDKISSQIFSIAFVLVLYSFMLAFAYLSFFLVVVLFKTFNETLYNKVKMPALVVLGILYILLLMVLLLANKPKFKDNERMQKAYNSIMTGSTWLYLGMYEPLNYINLVFGSNMPRKKYYRALTLIGGAFFLVAIIIYYQKITSNLGFSIFETRKYYSAGTAQHTFQNSYYDNLRPADAYLPEASIQADVIDGPYLKLFINYNKVLDARLAKLCKEPTLPTKLKGSEKRALKDKAHLACLSQYFQVSIGDSSLAQPEFMYSQQGAVQAKGLSSYIALDKCKPGRHTLYIKTLDTDSLPKRYYKDYAAIPFWYAQD